MFTGIIQAIGSIQEIHSSDDGVILKINSNTLDLSDSKIGDSIAVNGVCLTVTQMSNEWFTADVSNETINCTTLSDLLIGDSVNLEKSLRINQGIDGHLVSGHVDGIGKVQSINKDGDSSRIKILVEDDIIKYIAKKGSICINGVSLTVNSVEDNIEFDLPSNISFDEDGETMGRVGNEFGATTGRSRRCGWIDLVALKYSIHINGVTQLMMMKGDVLSGFKTIKICTAYKTESGIMDYFPYDITSGIEPIYEEISGWEEDLTQMKDASQFPVKFQAYIDYLEKALETPIKIVSVGPDRKQTIFR